MNRKTLAFLFSLGAITLIAAFAFGALDDVVFQGSYWVWPFVMKLFGSTVLILGFALPIALQWLYKKLPVGAQRALDLPVIRTYLDIHSANEPQS